LNEFDIIRHYFARQGLARADVSLGIGDDAALLLPPPDQHLVVTTDTLVAGVHFPWDADPASIGHKALAVNLSDLAAMGAEAGWITLNLSLPANEPDWLEAFCHGFFDLAAVYGVQLVGGDTTRGPLSVSVTALGFVPIGQALTRAGARPGDRIYVSGTLGDAGLALALRQKQIDISDEHRSWVFGRLNRPQPRLRAGMMLRGIATACIDVSDGLLADLGHVLAASGVGASINLGQLPLSEAYRASLADIGWDTALGAGDDYELCFTVSPGREPSLHRIAAELDCPVRCIGDIVTGAELQVLDEHGAPHRPQRLGYDHFREQK